MRAKESSTAALTKGRSRLPSLTVFGTGISLAMCFGVAASAQLLPFRGIEPVVVFDVKMAIEGEGWRIGFQDDHGFYLDPYITGGQLDEDSWEFFLGLSEREIRLSRQELNDEIVPAVVTRLNKACQDAQLGNATRARFETLDRGNLRIYGSFGCEGDE